MKKPVIILLHVGYWLMYALLLLILISLMRAGAPRAPGLVLFSILMSGVAFLPALIAFYCFYTFLFSRLLSKRKILYFILAGLLVSMFTAIPGEIVSYFTIKGAIWNLENCIGIGMLISGNALLNGMMGLVMRGFIAWYGDIKIKEELNKKNYETELALIKSQINPHFLFNTINNIDALIMKDPVKASAYLNKLSDIMRFMLYETKTEKVLLTKELNYIEKYIELQKIRSANPNYVHYSVEGNVADLVIEPMLFIPFIENAFKHTENKNTENPIRISFVVEKDKITFECTNPYTISQQLKPEQSGLGNELIAKRLALLYPQKHLLEINDKNNFYTVKIELNIK